MALALKISPTSLIYYNVMNLTQKSQFLFQDLRKALAPLEIVNPLQGLGRISIIGTICLLMTYQAWLSASNLVIFSIFSIFAAIFYAFLLVCTHDAIHHTLTGWIWFDEIIARIIAYPILWAVGSYSELHDLHHGWNGINLQDPERVQLTKSESENLSWRKQWYFENQWLIDIFICGSLGLIIKAFQKAWQHQSDRPGLRQQLLIDSTGMVLVHIMLLTWVINHHLLWYYALFWLIVERIVGMILQTRDHIEHYGKWQTVGGQQLTQLYATRNLRVHSMVSWLMGGLNYHGVHHAFPRIPFNHLAEAYKIIEDYLQKYDLPPMDIEDGYIKTALKLSKKPTLINLC